MHEKTGDFREGESRSDYDMTKVAKVTDGFFAGANNIEIEKLQIQTKGIGISVGNTKDVKRVNFKD